MKYPILFILLAFSISSVGCGKSNDAPKTGTNPPEVNPPVVERPGSIGIVGDTANVVRTTTGGMVLMGGGADVEGAFKWMIERSGGGDVVILRATGTDAYNPFVNRLGTVNSVETLLINSRELANNDKVAYIIRNAEMVFIAGGDQSDYMTYWRGTKTEAALNYLLNEKKAPVGGTSAGCAILGGFYYSGEAGGVTSATALLNPYAAAVTLYNNDFLKAPFLQNVITDQHYLTREREGRHMVFLGRIQKDWNITAKGIAADERTAVCIDKDGKAKVIGTSRAYFLIPDAGKLPEQMETGKPVIWNRNKQAVSVYEMQATPEGSGNFNVATFAASEASGGKWYWWSVDNGQLFKTDQN